MVMAKKNSQTNLRKGNNTEYPSSARGIRMKIIQISHKMALNDYDDPY
jgi:hypothetical protein